MSQTDDNVVQYPNIDERQGRLQSLGQRVIGARRLSDTRGVLVREDHSGGFQLQYTLHDDTRIDRSRIDRAPEQRLVGQNLVHAVQEHDCEYLRSEENTSELQSLMRTSYTGLRWQKKTKKT